MGGGGHQQSFGDTASAGDSADHRGSIEDRRPFGDQSGGDLAKEAGINDIGSSGRQASNDDGSSRAGFFDNASNDEDGDDHDDMDMDSDDFDDGGSDDV